ncbi:MAG: patatin-like phospholipase family protein [Acidobacteriota bacterium]|nr:patatin-like phospholipase family protein [Acidobacteriota bacterium]
MAKRLAITIAGAVSLGSYEAGVIYEVLDAIEQHNATPGLDAAEKIEIDVLTGASSGGMTAAILAHKMLYAAGEFRGPYDNPLYNVWVKRVDLAGLVATEDEDTGEAEPAMRSIFSSNLVESVMDELLLDRYESETPTTPVRHSAAAPSISLGMTLTNLNGVDYGYEMHPGGKVTYTRHDDRIARTLDATTDRRDVWLEIKQAAVASGAFPLAFRAKELVRPRNDYARENLEPWSEETRRFTYTDGAVLQSEPLAMAKRIVNQRDRHWNNDSRFYLFITPHGKDSSVDQGFCEEQADYMDMAKRLAKVILAQSEFEDWLKAEEVNHGIDLLDARARGVQQSLRTGAVSAQVLQQSADALLPVLFGVVEIRQPREIATASGETLDEARRRIAHQYEQEMRELGEGSAEAIAFRDTVLVMERSANLGEKDRMRIYGITVSEQQLAGAELTAFLGFFHERYRQHDYDRGRLVARAVLQDPMLSLPGELGPLHYTPGQTRPINLQLNGLRLSDVPAEEQTVFREGMKRRVSAMVRELIGIWSYPANLAVIDPIMNALLDQVFREEPRSGQPGD